MKFKNQRPAFKLRKGDHYPSYDFCQLTFRVRERVDNGDGELALLLLMIRLQLV